MNTFALALRNLARNRRRSITTLAAIVVGMVAILLFGGYSRDIRYGLQLGFVRTSGHLQVQHRDYFLYGSGDPAKYGIRDYEHIIAVIRNDPVLAPMLAVVTPTLQIGGIAGNFRAGVSRTVLATGLDVPGQNALLRWNDYGFPGKPPQSALTNTPPDAAVVGVGVARVLRLCAALHLRRCARAQTSAMEDTPEDGRVPSGGSGRSGALPADVAALAAREVRALSATAPARNDPRLELLAATADGAPNVASLTVVKAVPQAVKELDDVYVAMHLAQAQRLVYGGDAPQVTAIILQLHHTGQIPAARARLERLLATTLKNDPLEVHDFATLNPSYGQTIALFGAIFGFIAVLIAVIVLFTVGNTMSMAVVERTPEVGTLRAIGVRRSGVRRMFICEGLLLGITGSMLGIAIALMLAAAVNHSGLTWTPPGRVEPVPLSVRVWGAYQAMAAAALGLTLVAVLSSWVPARRGANANIVEALRHA